LDTAHLPASYLPLRSILALAALGLWTQPGFLLAVLCSVIVLQVTLNQLALAPVTLCAVFAWNLGWTGQWHAVPGKIQNDLVPSMINGEQNSYLLELVAHSATSNVDSRSSDRV
jgi:hypothetical protein